MPRLRRRLPLRFSIRVNQRCLALPWEHTSIEPSRNMGLSDCAFPISRVPLGALLAACLSTLIPQLGSAEEADSVKLVGSNPLQGRPSYQIATLFKNGRWLIYVGHMPGKAVNPLT